MLGILLSLELGESRTQVWVEMILLRTVEILEHLLQGLRVEIIEPRLLSFESRQLVGQLRLRDAFLVLFVEGLAAIQSPVPHEASRPCHTQEFIRFKSSRLHEKFIGFSGFQHIA